MQTSPKHSKSETLGVLAVLFEQPLEYWHALRTFFSTEQFDLLVQRINSDQVNSPKLASLTLATCLINAIIGALLPGEKDGSIAWLSDALSVCYFSIGSLVGTLMVYKPLRWAGGIGTLKHTLVAGWFVAVTLSPFSVILGWALRSLLSSPLAGPNLLNLRLVNLLYSLACTVMYCRLVARIHHISATRVFWVSSLSSMAIFTLVFVPIVVVVMLSVHSR